MAGAESDWAVAPAGAGLGWTVVLAGAGSDGEAGSTGAGWGRAAGSAGAPVTSGPGVAGVVFCLFSGRSCRSKSVQHRSKQRRATQSKFLLHPSFVFALYMFHVHVTSGQSNSWGWDLRGCEDTDSRHPRTSAPRPISRKPSQQWSGCSGCSPSNVILVSPDVQDLEPPECLPEMQNFQARGRRNKIWRDTTQPEHISKFCTRGVGRSDMGSKVTQNWSWKQTM